MPLRGVKILALKDFFPKAKVLTGVKALIVLRLKKITFFAAFLRVKKEKTVTTFSDDGV